MKLILPIFLLLSQLNAFALNGLDLFSAKDSAITEYQYEAELNEIEAWKAEIEGSEVHVKIQSHDGDFEYGCHLHGSDMVCHEEDHHELKKNKSFSDLDIAFQAATKKLNRTLTKRGANLSIVTSYKVWKIEDHDHGHGEEADIWTKVTYELNGKVKTSFIQCHQHAGESGFFCHYKSSAQDEPTL